MLTHQISTLKNGLRIVTAPMPSLASATVMIGVGAGSRFETKKTNGLFHFIEHMAFKGTKKRPTVIDIASEIDGVGGSSNAFTDKEFTGYYIKLAAQKTELAFDILSDLLQNSIFDPKVIEKEKKLIIEEINMRSDNYPVLASEEMVRRLYGDNAMGWDTAGEKETVSGLKRTDFIEYIHNYYYPKNMVLAVSGGVKHEEILALAEKYFSSYNGEKQKKVDLIIPEVKSPIIKLINKKTEQAHLVLGLPGLNIFDKKRYQMEVLSAILGGGMSSRIFLKIREKYGLAYYVYADSEYYTDSGYFAIGAGVNLNSVEKSLELTLKEIEAVKKNPTKKEVLRAKEMLKGQTALALENSKAVAGRAASQLVLENTIRSIEEVLLEIEKVTADQIQALANEILQKNKMVLSIVGPYEKESQFSKLLS